MSADRSRHPGAECLAHRSAVRVPLCLHGFHAAPCLDVMDCSEVLTAGEPVALRFWPFE
jgi:hypothetical protein